MIRVLVAEDSLVTQRTIVSLLEKEPDIRVVGTANNGAEAVEKCMTLRPDLVTMDIFMPELDGLQATRAIMERCPTRIVIISSMVNVQDQIMVFEAIRAGAVEVIEKPHGVLRGNYAEVRSSLIRVLKGMIHARPKSSVIPAIEIDDEEIEKIRKRTRKKTSRKVRSATRTMVPRGFKPGIVVIGGSTGAPPVLVDILTRIAPAFSLPVIIVQHVTKGFGAGLCRWLDSACPLSVQIAKQGEQLAGGRVYLAPDDRHLSIRSDMTFELLRATRPGEYTPSIDRLFESTARVYGASCLGVLLSGMGSDGANGLLSMREKGAVTIGQNEASSVIYGMAKVARKQGGVMFEASPDEITAFLDQLCPPLDG